MLCCSTSSLELRCSLYLTSTFQLFNFCSTRVDGKASSCLLAILNSSYCPSYLASYRSEPQALILVQAS